MLVVTPAIGNLIRENKTFRINSAIQTGQKLGMQLLDDCLFGLWKSGKVVIDEVMVKAQNPDELSKRIAKAQAGMFDDEEDINVRARDGDGSERDDEEDEGPKRDGVKARTTK
jgi:twitching motility protein PilT